MDKIKEKIKNNKIEIVFIIIVIFLFIILTIDFNPKKEKVKTVEKSVNTEEKSSKIIVDIKGAVNNPGVYEMNTDSRVIDVINKAGGLKEEADTSMINLSKKIKDEMAITIYTAEETKEKEKECEPCKCPEVNSACLSSSSSSEDNKEEIVTNEKISINTATLEQLQTLNGIGEAKAKAIIGYRQTNGLFKKIEEIKNVSGIGDALFEKIKDDITI